jgi:D-alanyl-D-alanine carboxypeptidase/D-alanyl-D-alanine-endopeptidase (penicillin-binding protein 4)
MMLVSALAGYVPDPQGRPWVLVAFINHPNAGAARPALDALVDWVASGGMSGGLAGVTPAPAR